jgi:hypothetical protein
MKVIYRTDVSEEFSASIIRVTRIGKLGTLAVPLLARDARCEEMLFFVACVGC